MIHITPATQCHVEAIYHIESLCFPDPWSTSAIAHEIEHAIFLVAVDEQGIVRGHVSMRHIIDEGHISNIAVHPHFQQKGIGHQLLASLSQTASEKKITALTLEVRESNKAAIHLYTCHGFTPEGFRKNYYSMPTETGVIMWKNL